MAARGRGGPSTRSKAERLRLFCRVVDQVLARPAISEGLLSARLDISAGPDATTIDVDDSHDDAFRSLLIDFRKFHSPDEDVHFYAIANTVEQSVRFAEDLREANRTNRASWKRLERDGAIAVDRFGQTYRPEDWFDLWINGELFHNDPRHVESVASLNELDHAIGVFLLRNMVLDGVRVLVAERNLIVEGFGRGVFVDLEMPPPASAP